MSPSHAPVEVFCSYAHTDKKWLRQLETHLSGLQRQGLISLWHDRQLLPGTTWTETIDDHLETASVILLMISADFMASDYCYSVEMKHALERHEAGEARIIPILLRPVDGWQESPFAHLSLLPTEAKGITTWRNRDLTFADVVRDIRWVIEALTHLPKTTTPPNRLWNIPYARNRFFTGREELLDLLHQQLVRAGTTATVAKHVPLHAIKGLGGIGKTQIVVEYAYRSRDLDLYAHTLWVNAESEETIIASFTEIAELLPSFSAKNERDHQKLRKAIKDWLERCEQRWLLIFDNADDVSLVNDLLPQHGKGCILLTTRADAVGSLVDSSIEVENMGLIEGTEFLLHRAQRQQAPDKEQDEAINVVIALDGFPLALDQAGAYIEETRCGFLRYLNVYQDHRKDLPARLGKRATNYPHSVVTTWSLSFEKVKQANPAAAELLRLCAFLAPDNIPEELIIDGSPDWPKSLSYATKDLYIFNQVIEELLKLSLVKRFSETQTLSIHRLVQAVQIDVMEPEMRCQWAEKVVRAVNRAFLTILKIWLLGHNASGISVKCKHAAL